MIISDGRVGSFVQACFAESCRAIRLLDGGSVKVADNDEHR